MLAKLNPIHLVRFIIQSDLLFPLILILVYGVFWYFATGIIPTTEEIIRSFAVFYEKYGYEIIFAAALIESLILLGLPAPGGAAMALGVIFARTGQMNFLFVVFFAILGTMLGYIVDYLLGYHGFSNFLKNSRFGKYIISGDDHKKFSKKGLFFGFIYGNIGSITSLSLGVFKYKFHRFLGIALISTIIWVTLWCLLVYALGEIVITILSRYIFIVVILAVVSSYLMRLGQNGKLKMPNYKTIFKI